MTRKVFSNRLGAISDDQFQAALDRFELGMLIKAEPVPFGLFGQNVFVTSTMGEYVLRGSPHFSWQFPTEQFYIQQLRERTQISVPWPYLIDPAEDIFGWSYVLMPRLAGLQLADPEVQNQLSTRDKQGIAHALGENLAMMQELTWPHAGRYDVTTHSVQPFELRHELAWPFPVHTDTRASAMQPRTITYSERMVACIRHHLAHSREYNNSTTVADVEWAEELITRAQDALRESNQSCFVMEDYKEGNLVVTNVNGSWQVSGVFDFMQAHFGDGEADLSRQTAMYLDEDLQLAREFVQTYINKRPPRPGLAERFPLYMLADRTILWEFFQKTGQRWWNEQWTFRDWASKYVSSYALLF